MAVQGGFASPEYVQDIKPAARGERLHQLNPSEVAVMFVSLGVLLATARLLGEIARKLNQASVLGELAAGILLGPTILGGIWPSLGASLFPQDGALAVALHGLTTVAIAMFLLVAGMEVDLSSIWRLGRAALTVSVLGIVLPFSLGFLAAGISPDGMGREGEVPSLVYALFLATAMSISALPVIAKTLMDLGIYRSDLGMVVIASAVCDDLTGWLMFALILGMSGAAADHHGLPIAWTVAATLGFTAFILTIGRWLIHRTLPWIQAHTSWPGGVLGFALTLGLLGAAFTQWIGVHAVFGAFLVGVAIGDSSHLREQTRTIIHQFVSFIFAPLFFASIGLKLNFAEYFDGRLTVIVIVIACAGKIIGCGLGARWGGIARREAWAIGVAMNARGAMEIIVGLLGLQSGLIGRTMFVSLVTMAMATSLMSGPLMRKILRLKKPRRLSDFLGAKGFVGNLRGESREAAIEVLSQAACAGLRLKPDEIASAVLARESQGPTGLGDRIAVPHARLDSLDKPVVAVGLSRHGIDFDAPDGLPAQLIFLILTPRDDDGVQVEILADIARTFRYEELRQKVVEVGTYTEFLAMIRTQSDVGK